MADLGDLSYLLNPKGAGATSQPKTSGQPKNNFGGVDHGDLTHLVGPPESKATKGFLPRTEYYLEQAGKSAYEHPGETALGLIPYAGMVAPQTYEGYEKGGLSGAAKGLWQGTKEAAGPLAAGAAVEIPATLLGGPVGALAAAPLAGAAYGAAQTAERPYFHPEQGPVDPAEITANAGIGGALGGIAHLGLSAVGVGAGEEGPSIDQLKPKEPPTTPTPPPSPAPAPQGPQFSGEGLKAQQQPVQGPQAQFSGPGLAEQGPKGAPGQPAAGPSTPPEDRVLDRPAIRLENGEVLAGLHGQTHDQIKAEAEAHLGKVLAPATVNKLFGRVEHGFITDEGQFVNRPQARAEIKAKTGVDVGKASPTSEQLGEEQGTMPPGQGKPAQPADIADKIPQPQGGKSVTMTKAQIDAAYGQDVPLPKYPKEVLDKLPKYSKEELATSNKAFEGQRIIDAKSRSSNERIREVLPFDEASKRARELAAKGYDVTNRPASRNEANAYTSTISGEPQPEAPKSIPAPTAAPVTSDVPAAPPGATLREPLPDMFQEKGLPPNIQKWFDLAHAKEAQGDVAGAARYMDMAKTLLNTQRSKALQEHYASTPFTEAKTPEKPVSPIGESAEKAKPTSYTPETGQTEAPGKPPVVEKLPPKGKNASALSGFIKAKPRGILALPEPLVRMAEEVRDAASSLDAFVRRGFGGSGTDEAQLAKGVYRARMGERGANEFKVGQILDTVQNGMRSLTKAEQLDAMEREDKGIKQPTPELEAYHKVHDIIYKDLQKQTAETAKYTGIPETDIVPKFRDHYMRRAFRKTPDERTLLSISEPRKNLLGQRGYTKERTQQTLYDAVQAARSRGMELVTNDPIEMEKHHYGEMQKYLTGLKALKDQQDLGLREFVREPYQDDQGKWQKGDMPKPGWVPEPTEIARSYGPLTPQGEKQKGRWYTPEGVARVTRNHLSVSLWDQPWYRVLRSGTNLAVEWKLGLSVFHGLGTAMNAFVSDLSSGVRYTLTGHPLEAIPKLARAATIVGPVISHYRQGARMLREFEGTSLRDSLPPHLQSYFDAGGRIINSKYDSDVIVGRMVDSFQKSLHTPGIGGKALAAAKLPFAAMEKLAEPIFKHLVPNVKMSVFKDMIAHNTRGLDPVVDKAEYYKVVDRALNDIDDRFGQVHYDNLFWYKPFQNMIHLLMQAPGWFLGNWRAFGGGAMDLLQTVKGKGLSDRSAFALSYPLGIAMTSMVTQYLMTGTIPKLVTNAESNFTNFWLSWRNFMHPETGRKRDDGSPERIQLPSYIRELENISEILPPELGGAPGGMGSYFSGKESPLVALTTLALTNADWKNQQIANPNDPYTKIAADVFKAGAEQVGIPISVQNLLRGRAAAQGSGQEKAPNWQALLGISVPKAKWQGTPFRNALYAAADKQKPKGPFSAEDAQKMQLRAQVRGMYRRGATQAQVMPYLKRMFSMGMFNPHLSMSSQVERLMKEGTADPLQSATRHADMDTILENYKYATPEEQQEVTKIIGARLAGKGKLPSTKNRPILQHIMSEWMRYEATHPEDAEKLKSERDED